MACRNKQLPERLLTCSLKRNLWGLAAIRDKAQKCQFRRRGAIWAVGQYRWPLEQDCSDIVPIPDFPNMLAGWHRYYVPQIGKEIAVGGWYQGKLNSLLKGYKSINDEMAASAQGVISTSDARAIDIPTGSVDYIFTDPPYSDNVQYGELNFVWEAWLDLDTHWHNDEIIVNYTRERTRIRLGSDDEASYG